MGLTVSIHSMGNMKGIESLFPEVKYISVE